MTTHTRKRVGILGASGLIGLQLQALLDEHPDRPDIVAFSRRHGGRLVGQVDPAYRHCERRYVEPSAAEFETLDFLFMSMPLRASADYAATLEQLDIPIIDIGGDYRTTHPVRYRDIHDVGQPAPAFAERFVSILPEIDRDRLANRPRAIALPGCVSTAALLGLMPLLEQGLVDTSRAVFIDAKVPSSGAGQRLEVQQHYQRAHGVRVHTVLDEHRHREETSDFVSERLGSCPPLSLSTYSIDLVRGISCAVYLELAPGIDRGRLQSLYRDTYARDPFVRILRQARGLDRLPNPKLVIDTNFCDVGFHVDEVTQHGVIIVALDNLIKGGAGQALQCFNALAGYDDDVGLPKRPCYPC